MMACGLLMLSIAPRAAFAQPTAQEWNRDVIGWNLGNQLECPAPGLDNESMDIGMAPNSLNAETAWGNPVVTRKTIEAVREAGFNAIRIPVQWSCHITNPRTMTIDPAWMSRVREIIGWCLDAGLKVIVNTHHDKWLEGRPTNQYKAENNRRLAQLWTNIARALSQYDYRVAFAGTNEVHIRDNWGKPAAENLAVQNSYNQTFVNAVRATGGKNAKRHLIVQTYVCNPDFGLDGGGFIIPTDARANGNRYMSVEFHYYTPWDYAGLGKYYFWGEPYKQYGQTAPSDEQEMTRFFDRVAATWSAKGLGIVIGEWGVSDHYNAPQAAVIHENMAYYCRFLVSEACKRGFSTFVWDNNAFGNGQEKFGIFDRSKGMTVRAPWILQGLFGSSAAARQSAPRPYAVDEALERRVEATLAKMTLDEKIGQMTELSLDALGKGAGDAFQFDEKKLHEAIAVYKVGSVLNAPGPVAVSPQRWRQIIGRIQELSMKEIGIPCIYGLDQNHGVTYTMGGILFPQNINLGASFNPQLAEEAGRITAYETRAANCPWTYSPTVDLSRDPRWPRVWENYGEDPLVNALMGSAAVRGFQGTDPNRVDRYHIAACMKHYLGYGSPRTGKDRTPAYIPESELREKCFAPFKAMVEAGALSVMVNSGSVNGLPVHASYKLITEWLKDGLNWDGMVVTDWSDINNLYQREHVAANKKEAIRMAINAGIDMSMDPYDLNFCTLLKELVQEGQVSQSRIDDAVRRVLRLKYRLGLFDSPNTGSDADYPDFASGKFAAVALQAAEESQVLLKNTDGLLPLAKGKRILVTGPNANQMRCLNGGWSYTWQGHQADRYAQNYNTIYEALCNRFGKEQVILEQGVTYVAEGAYAEENEPQIERAVRAAKRADVIIACIGENSYTETPGNLSDLVLSANQRALVKALAKTGKPLVLVLNEGRPRLISDIEPLAQAVVNMLLPGNYGGDALARLLAGDANFSARLPYTYPRHQAELTTYDYRVSEETDRMEGAYDYDAVVSVQWPFGYGLSYTTFEYSNFKVDKTQFKAGDTLTFTVDVKNTGSCDGRESVLLFSRDMVASLVPENRRLRAFQKTALLKPGQSETVTLTIPASALAFVDTDGRWLLEAGLFRMQTGKQTLEINCQETAKW